MNKLIRSSADPEKVGVTFQGAVTLIVIMVLPMANIDLSVNEVTATMEAIFVIIANFAILAGVFRKLWIGFKLGR